MCLYARVFAATPQESRNLATALASVTPPTDGVTLTVGAASVTLPADATAPGPNATLQGVADAFHRALHTFGTVTALAPPTMTLLNDRPVNPNIFDGIQPQDAMKFLVASLTQGQWQLLTGDQGLGLSDMASATQAGLFTALLPHTLKIAPQQAAPGAGARDLTTLLPQVRLRLRSRVELMVPELSGSTYITAGTSGDAGRSSHYKVISSGYELPGNSLYGVPVRDEVPNARKPGGLDLDASALRVAVPLAGTETVGALIGRVGRLNGLELYADRRWEGRTVTVVGSAPSAPAADFLRALAFCLTGTYRRVGTAYVLTDDIVGVGARRARWAEFEDTAAALRRQALAEAADSSAPAHTLTELRPADDSVAYSPAQQKQADRFYADTGFSSVTQTSDQLTPGQRDAVQAVGAVTDRSGVRHVPDPNGQIIVQQVPALEMLVPGVDGPVDSGLSPVFFDLFRSLTPPSDAPPAAAPPPVSPPPLADLLRPIRQRAVLAAPRTTDDLRDLVGTMQRLGLNQLWLPVAPAPDGASAPHLGLLPQALAAARGTGIAVYAALDLLARPPGAAPENQRDRTLLGQDSAQARAAHAQAEAVAGVRNQGDPVPGVAVSPFSPVVIGGLEATTRALADTPGLTGVVWRGTVAPGYDGEREDAASAVLLALGYTEPARLAFLRREHADPVDLFPPDARGLADTSLPNFDDVGVEQALDARWHQFRADADLALLRDLYRQAASVSGPLPSLLVQERGGRPALAWYGSWSDPAAPLPAFVSPPDSQVSEKLQARALSSNILVSLPLPGPLTESAILDSWAGGLQSLGKSHSWDGFVLDCLPVEH